MFLTLPALPETLFDRTHTEEKHKGAKAVTKASVANNITKNVF